MLRLEEGTDGKDMARVTGSRVAKAARSLEAGDEERCLLMAAAQGQESEVRMPWWRLRWTDDEET